MIKHLVLLFSVALLVAAPPSGAQAQATRIDDQQLSFVDPSIRAGIRAIADSALAAGLSAEPILDLARKGRTKGVAGALVLNAARESLVRLRHSQVALGTPANSQDISAGAEALRQGATAESLTRIAAEKRAASLYVGLGVLTELLSDSVPLDLAVRSVTRLMSAGARDADLTNFRVAVANDVALGALPTASVTTRIETAFTGAGFDASAFVVNGPATRAGVPGRPRIPPEN